MTIVYIFHFALCSHFRFHLHIIVFPPAQSHANNTLHFQFLLNCCGKCHLYLEISLKILRFAFSSMHFKMQHTSSLQRCTALIMAFKTFEHWWELLDGEMPKPPMRWHFRKSSPTVPFYFSAYLKCSRRKFQNRSKPLLYPSMLVFNESVVNFRTKNRGHLCKSAKFVNK